MKRERQEIAWRTCRERTALRTYDRAPHISCANTYAYIAHFNSFVGYIENLGCMALTRQSALNDFVSNMRVLAILTAFDLLK